METHKNVAVNSMFDTLLVNCKTDKYHNVRQR